ncbi:hypothetical protein BsWGS_08029 [Bradybaena similaris]
MPCCVILWFQLRLLAQYIRLQHLFSGRGGSSLFHYAANHLSDAVAASISIRMLEVAVWYIPLCSALILPLNRVDNLYPDFMPRITHPSVCERVDLIFNVTSST